MENGTEELNEDNVDFGFNLPDVRGFYAITSAIENENPDFLLFIIEHGGDVNIDLGSGQTPLFWAIDLAIDGMIQNNYDKPLDVHLQTIRILIEHNADLHKPDNRGKTPVDLISSYSANYTRFIELRNMFTDVIPNIEENVKYKKLN